MEQMFLTDNFQNCYLTFEGVDFVRLFMFVTRYILDHSVLSCVLFLTILIITAFAKTNTVQMDVVTMAFIASW